MKNEIQQDKITIDKSIYDMILKDAMRFKFINHYRPCMTKDTEESSVEFSIDYMGIVETLRYGTVEQCVDGAINDMREYQKVFWVGEESEIYAARTIQELLSSDLFSEGEMEKILSAGYYGEITDLEKLYDVIDESSDMMPVAEEVSLKEILNGKYVFPCLLLTAYH